MKHLVLNVITIIEIINHKDVISSTGLFGLTFFRLSGQIRENYNGLT